MRFKFGKINWFLRLIPGYNKLHETAYEKQHIVLNIYDMFSIPTNNDYVYVFPVSTNVMIIGIFP